ncbi:MAG TPA: hypothetical protein DEP87_00995 [Candidatus Pacebacteria bacterium]|nr:hypothetical protein [Candidatus Paceibacterota bacterium]
MFGFSVCSNSCTTLTTFEKLHEVKVIALFEYSFATINNILYTLVFIKSDHRFVLTNMSLAIVIKHAGIKNIAKKAKCFSGTNRLTAFSLTAQAHRSNLL